MFRTNTFKTGSVSSPINVELPGLCKSVAQILRSLPAE
ncbi:unnamed protein product [Schistosoma curassoni]|nr:unnamed protein product [Schistosoma curassoni]